MIFPFTKNLAFNLYPKTCTLYDMHTIMKYVVFLTFPLMNFLATWIMFQHLGKEIHRKRIRNEGNLVPELEQYI